MNDQAKYEQMTGLYLNCAPIFSDGLEMPMLCGLSLLPRRDCGREMRAGRKVLIRDTRWNLIGVGTHDYFLAPCAIVKGGFKPTEARSSGMYKWADRSYGHGVVDIGISSGTSRYLHNLVQLLLSFEDEGLVHSYGPDSYFYRDGNMVYTQVNVRSGARQLSYSSDFSSNSNRSSLFSHLSSMSSSRLSGIGLFSLYVTNASLYPEGEWRLKLSLCAFTAFSESETWFGTTGPNEAIRTYLQSVDAYRIGNLRTSSKPLRSLKGALMSKVFTPPRSILPSVEQEMHMRSLIAFRRLSRRISSLRGETAPALQAPTQAPLAIEPEPEAQSEDQSELKAESEAAIESAMSTLNLN